MKYLYLVRHAQAESSFSISDFERPLTAKGVDDATNLGELLAKENIKPNLILASSAKRTTKTAQILAEKINYAEDKIIYDKLIYGASGQEIIKLIDDLDNQYERVFIVGHNPTVSMLANRLGCVSIGNMQTCSVVGIEFDMDLWELIEITTGRQLFYYHPVF